MTFLKRTIYNQIKNKAEVIKMKSNSTINEDIKNLTAEVSELFFENPENRIVAEKFELIKNEKGFYKVVKM